MSDFAPAAHRWYGLTMFPGYGDAPHHSPICVDALRQAASGHLEIEFYHLGYAAGVRDQKIQFWILKQATDYLVGESEINPDRTYVITSLTRSWMETHYPKIPAGHLFASTGQPVDDAFRRLGDELGAIDLMGNASIERKFERDIDLILAEEFIASPSFAAWMWQKTRCASLASRVNDVFVSKSDADGESDLVVIYELSDGTRFGLLIEDKINAPFQPDQEIRYRKRGTSAVTAGEFADFMTVLCAPQFYLDGRETAQLFDIKVSYGDIAAFLRTKDASVRGLYRADFLEGAADQSNSLWTRIDDAATNEFWDAATRIAAQDFRILEMKKQVLTKNSTWIKIRPGFMPTGRKQVSILLKGDRGFVDLTFSNTDAGRFSEATEPLLSSGMTICQTTASTAIRIEVPAFRIPDGIEVSLPKIRAALAAAATLAQFYKQHQPTLDRAALGSTPSGR